MDKSQLKALVKIVLKEIEEPATTVKLLDNWKQVSTVRTGRMRGTRGYFIMRNGKLVDTGFEMEGSSGLGGGVDHFGFSVAVENRKMFGIPDEIADNPEEDDNYFKIWKYIEKAISARVRTMIETANTHRPDIFVQIFDNISPKSALRMVQGWIGKQVPDAPENSQVSVEIGNQSFYFQANSIKEFLSAQNPRDLKNY